MIIALIKYSKKQTTVYSKIWRVTRNNENTSEEVKQMKSTIFKDIIPVNESLQQHKKITPVNKLL